MNTDNPPIAVVTGASKGIGRAIARRLSADGLVVWALARDAAALRELASASPRVMTAQVDITDAAAVESFFADRAAAGDSIDVLVNNAALQGGAPITEQSLGSWRRFLDTNVTGAWLMIKHARPLMRAGGSIVNIGSVASLTGFADRAAYCASKHALAGMTRALAAEFAAAGIRVNLLCLGTIDTPGLRRLAAVAPGGIEAYENRQLMGRLGAAEEAAAACAFLASDESGFMTGSIMTVDGGLLIKQASALGD